MKDLVNGLFSSHGYTAHFGEGFDFFASHDTEKQTYWLVVEATPQQVFENQHTWLTACQNLYNHDAVQKNTNLICLWPISKIDAHIISEVHTAEEDLFFFKKHVIYYTQNELSSLNKKLQDGDLTELIHNSVNSSIVFSEYKSLLGEETWQELIYRLVIKLGFIDIGDGETADIEGLYTSHKAKILNTKQPELLSLIESSVLDTLLDSSSNSESVLNDLFLTIAEAGHEVKY
ncbi:ABC-three component system middle component 1 [Pseudomonas sp.]|uniref:ABC-three component system middle component 1 n=1 Tax=Pseudomonas sp. TaxID=306 RepID=UPI003C78ACE0